MKMMVPTLAVKEVTASEYIQHWEVVFDHAHSLTDRFNNCDTIAAALRQHFISMQHQVNSVACGFVSTTHADLLQGEATASENILPDPTDPMGNECEGFPEQTQGPKRLLTDKEVEENMVMARNSVLLKK